VTAAVPSKRDQAERPGGKSAPLLEVILLALAVAVVGYQLFVPPIVGLANNGDFSRVAEPLGIFPPPEMGNAAFFDWIVPQYRFDPKRIWFHGLCCYSSETLFGILSLPVGLLISPPRRFDLRAIGIANLLGFLVAFRLLLLALRPLPPALAISGALLLLVIFTDVAYVSYFNSFYTEPSALIFFIACLGLALLLACRPDPPPWLAAGFFLCAALLTTSRPQNALLGLLLALLGIRLAWRDHDLSRRRLVVAAALAVFLVSLWYSRSTPGPLSRIDLYNAVFRELLTNSQDPKRDLVELGLPSELDRLAGTTGFSPNAPIAEAGFQKDFFDRIGYGKLARFYAARPGRVWKALERSASHAFDVRPLNVGNSARETGRPARSRTGRCAIWSRAKELLVPARLWFVVAYLLVNLVAALALRLRARNRSVRLAGEIWIAVVLVAAFQFSVSAVMDHESRRSLFLFNVASDLLFVALCLRAGTVFASDRAGWGRDMRTTGPSGDGVSLPPSQP
jgi:hypothetical protein